MELDQRNTHCEIMKSKLTTSIILLVLLVLVRSQSDAQVTYWLPYDGGDFYDSSNWLAGIQPSSNVVGVFDLSTAPIVELTQDGSVGDLYVTDGHTDITGNRTLNFRNLIVEGDCSTNNPNFGAFYATLVGDHFELSGPAGTSVSVFASFNDVFLSVDTLAVDSESSSQAGQNRVEFDGDLNVMLDMDVNKGRFSFDQGLGIVNGSLNIGLNNDTEFYSEMIVREEMFVTETNVGFGQLSIIAPFFNTGDFTVGLYADGGINQTSMLVTHSNQVINCDQLTIGGESNAVFTLVDAEPVINAPIEILSNGTILFEDECNLVAEALVLNGTMEFDSGENELISSIDVPITIGTSGQIYVDPNSVVGVQNHVTNHGGDIDVDNEINFFGKYLGDNDFLGIGEVRFHSDIEPGKFGISPVDPIGLLTFNGNDVILRNDSTYRVSITPDGLHDRLIVNGNALLQGGTVSVEQPMGPVDFQIGDSFTILRVNGGNLSGEFGAYPEGAAVWSCDGIDLVITYVGGNDQNNVVLRALPSTVLLGDVNRDGIVDLLDVGPFVHRLANGINQPEADTNQDCAVDLLDVNVFVDILSGN